MMQVYSLQAKQYYLKILYKHILYVIQNRVESRIFLFTTINIRLLWHSLYFILDRTLESEFNWNLQLSPQYLVSHSRACSTQNQCAFLRCTDSVARSSQRKLHTAFGQSCRLAFKFQIFTNFGFGFCFVFIFLRWFSLFVFLLPPSLIFWAAFVVAVVVPRTRLCVCLLFKNFSLRKTERKRQRQVIEETNRERERGRKEWGSLWYIE